MSYERPNSTDRLEQYRARQAARIEAMNRAIDEGRTRIVSSAEPAEETVRVETKQINRARRPNTIYRHFYRNVADVTIVTKRFDNSAWVGSRKSEMAVRVEGVFRPGMRVSAAAPIGAKVSGAPPKDGQLYAYDAKSGQMLPVEVHANGTVTSSVSVQRTHRGQQKQQQPAAHRGPFTRRK